MTAAEPNREPTAWEDINPPMVSARPQGQLSTSSDTETRTVFRNELTACLALTAPAGMTEESRREWLAVAWDTLKHIHPKDLARCAKTARQTCDHPAKVVPAIIKAFDAMPSWATHGQPEPETRPERLIEPNYVTPEEAAEILREVGLKPE